MPVLPVLGFVPCLFWAQVELHFCSKQQVPSEFCYYCCNLKDEIKQGAEQNALPFKWRKRNQFSLKPWERLFPLPFCPKER